MLTSRLLVAATIALVSIGCSNVVSPGDDLSAGRRTWKNRGITSYSVTISRYCECLIGGPVTVTVRNGIVESRTNVRTGAAETGHDSLFPTIEGLFDVIENAISEPVDGMVVHYDLTLGYPLDIALNVNAVESLTIHVSNFVRK